MGAAEVGGAVDDGGDAGLHQAGQVLRRVPPPHVHHAAARGLGVAG